MKNEAKLTPLQKAKDTLWHKIYPLFPTLQKHLIEWRIIWHKKGRQRYHLGWLAPGKTLAGLEEHLHSQWGFGNHFVAWADSGQVLSWRKLVDFDHQYHIRVFKDGEIRGHYEYTPESKPIAHFAEKNETAQKAEFKKFLGNFLTDQHFISHLKPDLRKAPESELTIDEALHLKKDK